MAMARVVITGGSGYVGSHLAARLIPNHDVLTLDINLPRLRHCNHALVDMRDKAALTEVVYSFRPDIVYHLAAARQARESVGLKDHYTEVNIAATKNLLGLIGDLGARLIFTSSCSVFGSHAKVTEDTPFSPQSPYAETKIIGEQLIADSLCEQNYLILRLFNVVGSLRPSFMDTTGDALMRNFRAAVTSGEKLPIYGNGFETPDGTAIREYMHVGDIIDLLEKASDVPLRQLSLKPRRNVAGGTPLSVQQIADVVNKAAGRTEQTVVYLKQRAGDPAIITSEPSIGFPNWAPRKTIEQAISKEIQWLLTSHVSKETSDQY